MLTVRVIAVTIHLLGVAFWLGSLFGLALMHSRQSLAARFAAHADSDVLDSLWKRFRLTSLHSAGLIFFTGLWNIANVLITRSGNVPTGWMHIVATKIVILAAVLLIQFIPVRKALSRRDPESAPLGWSVLSIVLAVLAIAAGSSLRMY